MAIIGVEPLATYFGDCVAIRKGIYGAMQQYPFLYVWRQVLVFVSPYIVRNKITDAYFFISKGQINMGKKVHWPINFVKVEFTNC